MREVLLSRCDRVAIRWYDAIRFTQRAHLSRNAAHLALTRLSQGLTLSLVSDDPGSARWIGEELAELTNLDSEVIDVTHRVLAEQLCGGLPLRDTVALQHRLITRLGEVSSGYYEYTHRKLLCQCARDERKLWRGEARFRVVFEGANLGIALIDANMHLLEINPALRQILGYTQDELCQKRVADLTHPEDRALAVRMFREMIQGFTDSYELQKRYMRKDSSVFWARVQVSCVRNRKGKPFLVVALVEDVTERKQAESALRDIVTLKETNKLKDEILSLVSHELRTPLTSIKGTISSMLGENSEWCRERCLEDLQAVNDEVDYLARMVTDLLDIAALERGRLESSLEDFELATLAQELEERLSGLLVEHALVREIPNDLPLVCADYEQVGRVLTNLVSNGVKFSPKGTVIRIRAEPCADAMVVSVSDEGCGVAPEDAPHLFDRFYRGRHSHRNGRHGTGLGLAISKGIIEQHGGRIWVESEPGHRTVFRFTLPLAEEYE